MKTKRIIMIIAIILVIIGHCLDNNSNLKELIYTFHMPLFFIISRIFL